MTQGGSYDYWNASATQPLEALYIPGMASLVELKIINFRGKFDIPPPTSSQTAATNNRNTDYWAAFCAKAHNRVDGALLEESLKVIHWEMRLIEAVFPSGDERGKKQALQHWKDVRALHFDEVNEDVFYEDESGDFQRRRSKGWRLRS